MRILSTVAIALALLTSGSSLAQPRGVHVVCTSRPTFCSTFHLTPDDRFDPFVQHLLVRQELDRLPTGWRAFHAVLPYEDLNRRHLEEMQIRFINDLLREREFLER